MGTFPHSGMHNSWNPQSGHLDRKGQKEAFFFPPWGSGNLALSLPSPITSDLAICVMESCLQPGAVELISQEGG